MHSHKKPDKLVKPHSIRGDKPEHVISCYCLLIFYPPLGAAADTIPEFIVYHTNAKAKNILKRIFLGAGKQVPPEET